jgi:hypothetical protein
VGKAQVKLSFAAWTDGKVSPATDELQIIRPEPKK